MEAYVKYLQRFGISEDDDLESVYNLVWALMHGDMRDYVNAQALLRMRRDIGKSRITDAQYFCEVFTA